MANLPERNGSCSGPLFLNAGMKCMTETIVCKRCGVSFQGNVILFGGAETYRPSLCPGCQPAVEPVRAKEVPISLMEHQPAECLCQTCGQTFSGEVSLWRGKEVWRRRECDQCRATKEERTAVEREEYRRNGVAQLKTQWLHNCGFQAELLEKNFENWDQRRENKIYGAVKQWAEEFPLRNPRGYPSLILWSQGNGVGKTHLLAAAGARIIQRWDGDPGNAICPVRFASGAGLVRRIRATYGDLPGHETAEMVYDDLKTVPLLLLDDVGKENASPHTREVYFYIIDERVTRGLPVFLTSNLPLEGDKSLEELMGSATVSRLIGMSRGQYYELRGDDYRRRKLVP